jgi:hypothetical protein
MNDFGLEESIEDFREILGNKLISMPGALFEGCKSLKNLYVVNGDSSFPKLLI